MSPQPKGQPVVLDEPVEDEPEAPLQAGEVDRDIPERLAAAIPGGQLDLGALERLGPDLPPQDLLVGWRAGLPGQLQVAFVSAI